MNNTNMALASETVVTNMEDLMADTLSHFQWEYDRDVLRDKHLAIWNENKASVREALRSDEDWNEEKQYIHKRANYYRPVWREMIEKICSWLRWNLDKCPLLNEVVENDYPHENYRSVVERSRRIYSYKRAYERLIEEGYEDVVKGGEVFIVMPYDKVCERYNYLKKVIDNKNNIGELTEKSKLRRDFVIDLMYFLKDLHKDEEFTSFDSKNRGKWNEGLVKKFNALAEHAELEARAVVGQKFSKPIFKVLKELGYGTITEGLGRDDMASNELKTSATWALFQSRFGDAVSPIRYERHTIISINPNDFLRMSIGYKWQSCHTIDKANVDEIGGDAYEGQYCGGTLSYMLDTTSFVYYTVDKHYDDNSEFSNLPKMTRQMFHIGTKENPWFVQGRMYPQSNDYGADGEYSQYRQNVQSILTKAWGLDNQWKCSPSKDCGMIITEGRHYDDYNCYDVCKVCYNQTEGHAEYRELTIGHEGYCITCGTKLYESGTISDCFTPDRMDRETCEECGWNGNEEYFNWVYDPRSEEEVCVCDDCYSYCDYCDQRHPNGAFIHPVIDATGCTEEVCGDAIREMENGNLDEFHWCEDEQMYVHTNCIEVFTEDNTYYRYSSNAERYDYRYCEDISKWSDDFVIVNPDTCDETAYTTGYYEDHEDEFVEVDECIYTLEYYENHPEEFENTETA